MKTIKLMHQVLWISYATREENQQNQFLERRCETTTI